MRTVLDLHLLLLKTLQKTILQLLGRNNEKFKM